MLDQTTTKILASDPSIETKMRGLAEDNGLSATLTYKYGFDGSGSHSRPVQPDRDGDHSEVKSLLLTQMVPLEMSALVEDEEVLLWKCSRPNNPHACRPLRLSFEAENKDTINLENDRLSTEISNLECFLVSENPRIEVSYKGLETLVDGKVVSALTNKNLTKCVVCDASRSEMASGQGPFNPVSVERLSFGISPLHFSLRAFETILHIGYKQDVRSFQVKKADAISKHLVEIRTQQVKDSFLTELGLKVDRPTSGGTTNTGNLVRKAFTNSEITARICGVSTVLVSNLDTIRRAFSSGCPIDPEELQKICQATLIQYNLDAGWYSLSPTLHRVLVHGKEIVQATPLPIGITSEEGSEANTKFARQYLKHHTRKTSNMNTIVDLFNRLMDISDPLIISFSKEKAKKATEVQTDLAALCPSLNNSTKTVEPMVTDEGSTWNVSINDLSFSEESCSEVE